MKKLSIYVLFAGFCATVFTSCKRDLLKPSPQTNITDETAFDFPYRISNQVLSLYSVFKAGGFYGGRLVVYGDIRGEDFSREDPNLVTNADVWEQNPTNSANAVLGLWAAGYQVINQVNVFIDGMNAKGTAVVGEATSKIYIAEARLLRAIAYHNLVQYYARPYADGNGSKLGLPLRLTGIKSLGFSDLARSTVAEVYTQIIADLDFAEANLPATNSSSYNNTTRAHKNTAIAYKTRVYLTMQNYPKVIEEANKIVPAAAPYVAKSGVPHALNPDYTAIFKTPYTSSESIFSVPFSTTTGDGPGTQNGLQSYFYVPNADPIRNGVGTIFSLDTTVGIINSPEWGAADKRRAFVSFPNPSDTRYGNLRRRYLTKYSTTSSPDYTPVIRWAEVLLNLAEARVRSTNSVDAQALDIVNAIRKRSDPAVTLVPATPAALTNAIMLERRIEFLGEGLRVLDLLRLLQTIPAKGVAPSKAPNDDGYIWPASANEKALNKLWVD